MKPALLLAGVFSLLGCAPGSRGRDDQSSQPNTSGPVDELANKLETQMSRGWENALAEMQGEVRQKCGTSIVISDPPVIINGQIYAFWITPSATAEQIACVQRLNPEMKTAPK